MCHDLDFKGAEVYRLNEKNEVRSNGASSTPQRHVAKVLANFRDSTTSYPSPMCVLHAERPYETPMELLQ